MQDLTQGSISKHIIRLAAPMAAGMIFQTMYVLIDLYFVTKLGDASVAGVGAAANVQFIVLALTQILNVGTMVLISHAAGRKDQADANLVFNQGVLLAASCAAITLIGGYSLTTVYIGAIAADAETAAAGATYLRYYLPGLALQFALVTMGAALRGTGIAKPTMIVQVLSVVLNAVLAPMLIAGWGTGRPLGVAGAGLASSIAIAAAVIMLLVYFVRNEKYVSFDRAHFHARMDQWKRILRIGLPAGGEFALMAVFIGLNYFIIRDFGAHAQAGYSIGSRVMQSIFLPAMAIAFAAAPVAGQNVGAGKPERARETFTQAALIGSGLMLVLTLVCQFRSELFLAPFATQDPEVMSVGAEFLRIISLNFVASGIIFTCSGMFQALGNTLPSLISSGSRLLTFALPALWLASRPSFQLRHLWYLSVVTVFLQMLTSAWLVRREFARKLVTAKAPVVPMPV
ncbi:MAG: MATE family efflux transporter [Phycisphaerae bacterium]|nr:MATE family efflux transporter [Gemmatimonadaceae bacterium]